MDEYDIRVTDPYFRHGISRIESCDRRVHDNSISTSFPSFYFRTYIYFAVSSVCYLSDFLAMKRVKISQRPNIIDLVQGLYKLTLREKLIHTFVNVTLCY